MVKLITLDPCLGSSESGSRPYTKFELGEVKNILIYKDKQFMMTNKFQEKSTYSRRQWK